MLLQPRRTCGKREGEIVLDDLYPKVGFSSNYFTPFQLPRGTSSLNIYYDKKSLTSSMTKSILSIHEHGSTDTVNWRFQFHLNSPSITSIKYFVHILSLLHLESNKSTPSPLSQRKNHYFQQGNYHHHRHIDDMS